MLFSLRGIITLTIFHFLRRCKNDEQHYEIFSISLWKRRIWTQPPPSTKLIYLGEIASFNRVNFIVGNWLQ